MIAWLAALALWAQSAEALSGLYRTQQMEVGAALELRPDGTFRYSLDYGAVSEAAEGQWTAGDGVVHLASDPLAVDLLRDIERRDAGFEGDELLIEDGSLVLRRHDTVFVFHRDEE